MTSFLPINFELHAMTRHIPLSVFLLLSLLAAGLQAAVTLDFNELSLSPNSFFDGYGFSASTGAWTSQGATFETNQFGPGWSYSNVNDTTTAGFTNQWASITGSGVGGSGNYAIAAATVFPPPGLDAVMNLPPQQMPLSIQVTNSTYAYLSMLNGDAFAKKFGGVSGTDPDFFKAVFTGFSGLNGSGSVTGSTEFFLADFRFAQDYIVNQWTNLDLTPLGSASSIKIGFQGSDVGAFGLNTPAFIAVDNLVLSAIPEPHCLAILGLLILSRVHRQRRIIIANHKDHTDAALSESAIVRQTD